MQALVDRHRQFTGSLPIFVVYFEEFHRLTDETLHLISLNAPVTSDQNQLPFDDIIIAYTLTRVWLFLPADEVARACNA